MVFERNGLPINAQCAIFNSRPNASKVITKWVNHNSIKNLPKERLTEIKGVESCIKSTYGGVIIVCLNNVKIIKRVSRNLDDYSDYNIAEIDGVILEANKKFTRLHLIEAKSGRRSQVGEAQKQLKELLSKKELWNKKVADNSPEILALPNRKGASLRLRLP